MANLPITGSMALGYQATVTAERAVLFSLDGNPNTLNDAGKLKIVGDFEVTDEVDLDPNLSALFDALGT